VKILMLSWEFPPNLNGGLGRHVADLSPSLAERGVMVHVVTPYPEPTPEPEQIGQNLFIHRVDITSINLEADIHTQARQANSLLYKAAEALWGTVGGFDLIHVHDWLVSFAAIQLKQAYKCPIVATIHATEAGRWRSNVLTNSLSQAIHQAEERLTAEAWRVIACSRHMVAELHRIFHVSSEKVNMIPNGVHLADPACIEAGGLRDIKEQFVPHSAPLIFCVGRLVFEKGQHILIGAMPEVLSVFPDARLVLAGKGPLLGYLQTIVQDMGLQDHVHFAGFVTDQERDQFFANADCAVFPSLYEPFGIVALEAMACNCPVVVSNLDGLAEVVEHEQTGLLIYPDNSDSAAWAILQILKKPFVAKQYAANACQMIAERYSWQRIATQTIDLYQRVIDERAGIDW
jgi:glycosyltransferase involved in cell wall biosynthesis